ncbi:MAG: STAS domain-containing protein [Lachnospiraceae bacterium]|nr:STAS domain-containing protein [Lachnospiraceae bacterium]
MFNIDQREENGVKYFSFEGELDTIASVELEGQLDDLLADAKDIVVDLEKINYITSAGLRILLHMQKDKENNGSIKIINVSKDIMELFEVTGFDEILNIE